MDALQRALSGRLSIPLVPLPPPDEPPLPQLIDPLTRVHTAGGFGKSSSKKKVSMAGGMAIPLPKDKPGQPLPADKAPQQQGPGAGMGSGSGWVQVGNVNDLFTLEKPNKAVVLPSGVKLCVYKFGGKVGRAAQRGVRAWGRGRGGACWVRACGVGALAVPSRYCPICHLLQTSTDALALMRQHQRPPTPHATGPAAPPPLGCRHRRAGVCVPARVDGVPVPAVRWKGVAAGGAHRGGGPLGRYPGGWAPGPGQAGLLAWAPGARQAGGRPKGRPASPGGREQEGPQRRAAPWWGRSWTERGGEGTDALPGHWLLCKHQRRATCHACSEQPAGHMRQPLCDLALCCCGSFAALPSVSALTHSTP
jgi:hypothetical protein